jgi:hypothetical protein
VRVTVRDSADLKSLSKQLRQVADGKQLRKQLTGGIRDALKPVLAQVKAGYGSGHLRGQLRRAARIEVRTSGRMAGARLRVDGRKMPDQMKSLPAMWEGLTRWRHPVFGDRETWVAQDSHPTFYRIVTPQEDRVGRAIDEVLKDVCDKLERGL